MEKSKKSILKKILIGIFVLLLALTMGFFVYLSDYYRADELATDLLQHDPAIQLQSNHLVISPEVPTDRAIIYYPGAKVEYHAYLPLLKQISERSDIMVFLVEMPFNMAIFDFDAANQIISSYPEVEHWFMSGHSMGGAMASDYASKNPDKVDGLILMGAYLYGSYPEEKTLTIYGTLNSSVADNINYTSNIVVIEGGNHAQFGNYGPQRGDPAATITDLKQQSITVDSVHNFLEERRILP